MDPDVKWEGDGCVVLQAYVKFGYDWFLITLQGGSQNILILTL
jgi:hypothetical protein